MSVDFEEDFLQKIIAIHFPSKRGFLVLHYSAESSSNDVFGTKPLYTFPKSDSASIILGGQLAGKSFEDNISIVEKKKVVAKSFPPFRQDNNSTQDSSIWDYQAMTLLYGLKGSAFPRGSTVGHGEHSDDTFLDARNELINERMLEFDWTFEQALNNMVFLPLYDYMVISGQAPVNDDPSKWDTSAVTTKLVKISHGLEVFKYCSIVIDLSHVPFDRKKNTFTMVFDNPANLVSGNISLIAGWTYKNVDADNAGWTIKAPLGWNVNGDSDHGRKNVPFTVLERDSLGVPSLPFNFTTEPFKDDVNIGNDGLMVDKFEISNTGFSNQDQVGNFGSIVTIEIDMKTLRFVRLQRVSKK